MKSLLTTLFTVLFFSTAFAFQPTETVSTDRSTPWQLDANHSNVDFTIRWMMTPVRGSFSSYEAQVNFDPSDLENSMIDVKIDVNSVDTNNQRRDNHLLSDDFFNTEVWPQMHFRSTRIEQTGENEFVAHGEMTIRDVTKEFQLPFTLIGIMDDPRNEARKLAAISAEASLMRNYYGVGVGSYAATATIGNEVNIKLSLTLQSR
jgi:polyisoprenoid-binding protein YceI